MFERQRWINTVVDTELTLVLYIDEARTFHASMYLEDNYQGHANSRLRE